MFNRLHSLIYVTQDKNSGKSYIGKAFLLLTDDGCSDSSDAMQEG